MVRWARAAVVPLVLVGLIGLAGVVLGRIYADALLTQLVAGAALASVATGVAARRLPSWSVAPLSVVLLAGYTAASLAIAARRAALTGPLPDIAADAVTNGIPRLLTALIPVESTPDTVVVPVIAAWIAGLAGTEIAVRAGRVLLGCAPAVALYAGALYVVGPNEAAAGWPTLIVAMLVVAGLAVTPPRGGTDLRAAPAPVRGRALAGAATGLAVVVALIAAVGPWVGGRVSATPVDPRRYVEPPQVDSLDESPLNRISGWALNPDQRLLQLGPAQGPARGGTRLRMRLAVLSDYDGVTWRVGATYRNAGRVLPPQPVPPDVAVDEVRQDVTVAELTGRLLPVVPTPSEVSGARVAYDPATGTLIRPEGLEPGLRYAVVSGRQTPDLNLLPTADAPAGDTVARYLTVGAGVPESVQRLADQLADGNGAAYDRAVAIEEWLGEHYRKVADAPSGHAYPNLEYFLFGPRDRGGQVGTSEQFAASFALLARLTGLPSRVVVGFDAPAAGGAVTGAHALAWPEVLFEDLGWVAFDPLPRSREPRPVEEDFTPKPSTPPTTPPEATPPSTAPATSAPPVVAAPRPGPGTPVAVVAGGASGSVLLVLAGAALAVVLLRRAQRRRRLGDGPPDARIAGAWLEFTDALRLAGRPVPGHLAATEAAAFAAHVPRPRGVSPGALLRRAAPGRPPEPPPANGETAAARPSPAPAPADGRTTADPPAAAPDEGRTTAGPPAPARNDGETTAGPPDQPPLPPVDDLVAGVNASAFAPGAADEDLASRAGAQAVAYADALRSRRSWWRRAWWTVHPGPLRWHRSGGPGRQR
jgi:transglutaminase-like putative cysteine protease